MMQEYKLLIFQDFLHVHRISAVIDVLEFSIFKVVYVFTVSNVLQGFLKESKRKVKLCLKLWVFNINHLTTVTDAF